MAYQYVDQSPSSRYRLKNIKSYTTAYRSGTSQGQVSGKLTESLAKSEAEAAAKSNAESAIASINTTSNKDSVFGLKDYSKGTLSKDTSEDGDISDKNGGYRIGNTYSYGFSDKTISITKSSAQSATSSVGITTWSGDATASWSCYIGGGRNSYAQCYGFTLDEGCSVFKEGEIKIQCVNKSDYDVSAYVAISDTATFLNDYTKKSYKTFTITKNTTTATIYTISLSSLKSAINALTGENVYFIVGITSIANGTYELFSTGASLSYSYSYTKCTAPTNITVANFVKYSTDFEVSWSGATSGVNNAIASYILSYTIKKTDGSLYKTGSVTSTTTSATISEATEKTTRGYTYTFNVQTIGKVEGYDSSISTVSATCRINRLPTITISGMPEKVPSTGGTPTATYTMKDEDGQSLTAYYKVGADGEKIRITTAGTWTAPTEIKDVTTYYFCANDDLEDGEWVSQTVGLNVKPTFTGLTNGLIPIDGTDYESDRYTGSYKYIPIFNQIDTSQYEQVDVGNTVKERQYRIYYSENAESSSWNESYLSTYDNTLTSYNLASVIGTTNEGRRWQLRYRYKDDYEWSEWQEAESCVIAPYPIISAIYNKHDATSWEDALTNNFYQYLSITYTGDTAFFGNIKADNSNWEIAVDKGSLISTSQSTEAALTLNLVYKDPTTPSYGDAITFSLNTSWGSWSYSSAAQLIRCPNLVEEGAVVTGLPDYFKPYSQDILSGIGIPFKIGELVDGDFVLKGTEINLGQAPLSAEVKINDEVLALEYSSLMSADTTSGTIIVNWDASALQNYKSNSTHTAQITFYCTTVFREVFSISANINLDYREDVQISFDPETAVSIECGDAGLVSTASAFDLYEGEKLTFTFNYTGPNVQLITFYLYRVTDSGISERIGVVGGEIEEKNKVYSGQISYKIPAINTLDEEWSFQIGAYGGRKAVDGYSESKGTGKTTDPVTVGDGEVSRKFPARRFAPAGFNVTSLDFDGTGSSPKFNIKMTFNDYGSYGEAPYVGSIIGSSSEIWLEYQDGATNKKIWGSNGINIEEGIVSFEYDIAEEFPTGLTNINARVGVLTTINYPSIDGAIPTDTFITKTSYSAWQLIYNLAPTVRYGVNRIGINALKFSGTENLIELTSYKDYNTVAAVDGSINLDNFIISGGTWDA